MTPPAVPLPPTFAGVLKIARFNWPWYALAGALNLAAIAAWVTGLLPAHWILPPFLAGDFWLAASLIVSHLVYDRSGLRRGAWLDGLAGGDVAVLHAGQDEASALVRERLPEARVQVFDFFDAARPAEPSLLRARALAGALAPSADIRALPLPSASLDLACVVFAAHELRDPADRAAFFREVGRTMKSSGRVVVVEHLRDSWNALAYGPGVFHFLPRTAWTRTFQDADLDILSEGRCTPFVRIFRLGRRP